MNALPVSHSHYPTLRTITLGSLAKGELLLQCEALSTIEGSPTNLSIPTTIAKGQ